MKKIFLLFLCVTLALCFVSCKGNASNNSTAGEDVTTESPDNTDSPVNYISVADYALVRSNDAPTELVSVCSEAVKAIMKETKKLPTIITDFTSGLAADGTVENTDKEILIGATNRKESKEALATLGGSHDYVIQKIGSKIVVLGKTDAATQTALRVFVENYVKDGDVKIPENLNVQRILSGEGGLAYKLVSEYTVIRSAQESGNFALKCVVNYRTAIEGIANAKTNLMTDQASDNGKELLIGRTSREASVSAVKDLGSMDYTVRINGNKIVLLGGTPVSTLSAIDHFIGMIESGELSSLDKDFEYTYRFFDEHGIDPLVSQLESFKLTWGYDHVTPDWMRDFDEKTYSLMYDVRNISISHRADLLHYPENSIPAIISAIRAGCDVMEIDVNLTKDNVLILFHDDTLTKKTDFAEKAGKNGLPTSDKITDWTYDQLQQLRLKDSNGTQTDYRIPLFYEAMMLLKDNCFIHIDNKCMDLTLTEEVYYMAEEIGCKEILFFMGSVNTMKTYLQKNPNDAEFKVFVDKVISYGLNGGTIRKKYWCKPDSVESGTTDMRYENETRFAELTSQGKTFLWVNNIVRYCKWIAENCQSGLSK